MLTLSPATRVFVALQPVDFRLGLNGLVGYIETVLGQSVLTGYLFAFVNRRRTRLRLVVFDGSGIWLATKRLEAGRFGSPDGSGVQGTLRPEELQLLVHGQEGRSRPGWYRR